MRSFTLFFLAISAITSFCTITQAADTKTKSSSGLVYPRVKRIGKKWSFRSAKANGNVTYDDPYFWLEQPQDNNTDIQKFISDQTALTGTFMKRCSNLKSIEQSIQQATNYDKIDQVGLWAENTKSPFYLYTLRRMGEDRPTWYKASVAEFQAGKNNNFAHPPGKPYLNESLLNAKGTANIVDQDSIVISPDGKIFCYLVSEQDSDFSTWYFRSVDTPLINAKTFPKGGEGSLPVSIPLSQQAILWTSDSKGFYYVQATNEDDSTTKNMVRYHHWGTSTDKDITVVQQMPVFLIAYMSYDFRWLFVLGFVDNTYRQFTFASLLDGQPVSEKMKWISVSPDYNFQIYYITTIENTFYFQTDEGNATNSKVSKIHLDWSKARSTSILTDIKDRPQVQDVIKERDDALIPQVNAFAIAHDKVLINYVESGKDTLYLYDLKTGKMIQHLLANEYISSTGKIQASTVTIQTVRGTKASDFSIKQLFATSKDGSKVPYFVTQKGKDNGCRPTWVHGYGAYQIKESLFYSPIFFSFLNSYNSRFVWTAIRGGGDQGGKWHLDATTIHKQRTYDDWIAVLQDLEKRNLACSGQLIVEGASAGGMAALAVANQAVQGLIGVVLAVRAVSDYFLFALRSRIGEAQWSEFINPNIPADFDAIRAWSPLQNIDPKKQYPAILFTPGQDDDRVSPAHSYKMLAELQYRHPQNKLPLLMFLANGGHAAAGASVSDATVEASHQFCVIEEAFGISPSKVLFRRDNQ